MKLIKSNIVLGILTIIVVVSSPFFVIGQSPYLDWAVGHEVGKSWGYGITIDNNGNSYSTGNFQYTVVVPSVSGEQSISCTGISNCFVQKVDKNGEIIWLKAITGSGEIIGKSIAVDSLDNLYITGAYSGTADFDPGTGVVNSSTVATSEIFVLKLNSDGEFVWVKTMEGNAAAYGSVANDIKIDSNNDLVLTGNYYGTVDFDPGIDTVNSGSGGIFIQKLDTAGNYIWVKTINATSSESISCDTFGNVAIVGWQLGTADFDPGAGVLSYSSVTSYPDAYSLKLDQNGDLIWANFAGGDKYDYGEDLVFDEIGNVYVMGRFQEDVDFDPGVGVQMFSCAGSQDIFIQKFNPAGELIWAKAIGDIYYDYGKSIDLDSSGNIYLGGYFQGTTNLNPNGTDLFNSVGMADMFIEKLDSSGNFIWGGSFGGLLTDVIEAVCFDSEQNKLRTTGFFDNIADFDPTTGVFELENPDHRCMFTAQFQEGYLSIDEQSVYAELLVYPNPVQNEIYIVGNITEGANIFIYSMSGKLVYITEIEENIIDVSHLKEGHYILKIMTNDKVHSQQIFKY